MRFPSLLLGRDTLRHAANVAAFVLTFPLLFPFALLHELVHVAGFGLMRAAGFRVDGVRLVFSWPRRGAGPLCFAPLAVTVDAIRLGTMPRWHHRACALAAAAGPALFNLAGLVYAQHLAATEGHTALFYTAVLFTAAMIPSRDDLRAAYWSLTSPTLEQAALVPA